MKPIRLFISDIDGTLVRRDKSLGEPVADAFKRLEAAGVRTSLISARPLSGVTALATRLGIDAPVGAYNGGTLARLDGTVLTADRLARDVAARALELLDAPQVTPWVFADGLWHTTTLDNPHTNSERKSADAEPVLVKHFDALLDRVDKIVGVSDELDFLAELDARAKRALDGRATVARSQPYYLDVTGPRADKGVGVTAIAQALGVPLDQTAVIGDGHNDVAMFKVAGLSIAMGQGAQDVRDAADHVTLSNVEDGVAAAIDRFVLPAALGHA